MPEHATLGRTKESEMLVLLASRRSKEFLIFEIQTHDGASLVMGYSRPTLRVLRNRLKQKLDKWDDSAMLVR